MMAAGATLLPGVLPTEARAASPAATTTMMAAGAVLRPGDLLLGDLLLTTAAREASPAATATAATTADTAAREASPAATEDTADGDLLLDRATAAADTAARVARPRDACFPRLSLLRRSQMSQGNSGDQEEDG